MCIQRIWKKNCISVLKVNSKLIRHVPCTHVPWIHLQSSTFVTMKIILAHLFTTLTFISILNICIRLDQQSNPNCIQFPNLSTTFVFIKLILAYLNSTMTFVSILNKYPDWISNQIQPVSNSWIHHQHLYSLKKL